MKKIRNNHGVTLISLVVTIVIMMILTISLTASMTSTIELKKYNNIKEDIIALTEEIKIYYLKNESLPIYDSKTIDIPSIVYEKDRNPNDSGNYYPINISVLSDDLELNAGEGNKTQNFNTDDLYVVNESSLTVYYVQGVVLNGEKHYTIVDDFTGGSFAEEYYSKVELPIISVVTMESSGPDKSRACTGDIITLKMLSNYEFTTAPTVKINNEEVSTTWHGKVGIATYKLPFSTDTTNYGESIPFSISNYNADGRNGEEITKLAFGKAVYRYAETLVTAYKNGDLKEGDFLDYSKELDTSKSYTSVTNENGWDNQTYSVDTNTQWRVLGLNDEETQLLLISADPIKKNMNESSANSWDQDPYLYMKGAYSYLNSNKMLNDICKIYSTKLGTARSVSINDINKIMGVKVETSNIYYESDTSKTSIDLSVKSGYLGLGKKYINKSTDYLPQGYINDYTSENAELIQDGYWYDYLSKINTEIGNTTIGSLIFDGTQTADNFAKSYWIDSHSTYTTSANAAFGSGLVNGGGVFNGFGMFYSYGDWYAYRYAVRPVVSVNEDVTVERMPKIDGNVEKWNYDNTVRRVKSGTSSDGKAGN